MNKAQAYLNGLTPTEREELAEALERLKKKNEHMPSWKKKLYMALAVALGWWSLMQYLHYEACRQKYPQASGWVCLVQPK